MASNKVTPNVAPNGEDTAPGQGKSQKHQKNPVKRKAGHKENKKKSNENVTFQSPETHYENIEVDNQPTRKKHHGRRHTEDHQNKPQVDLEEEQNAKNKPMTDEVFENNQTIPEKALDNEEVKFTPLLPEYHIDDNVTRINFIDDVEKKAGAITDIVTETHYHSKRKQVTVVHSFDARTAMDVDEKASEATELVTNDCPVCEDDVRRKSSDHKHRDDRRHSDKHDKRRASAKEEERERRRSSAKEEERDRRRSSAKEEERERKKSSGNDKRRYSEQSDKRRNSADSDEKDMRRNEFFRRLSAIIGYDEEYRRNSKDEERRKSTETDKIGRRHSDDARRNSANRYTGRRNSSDPGNDYDNRRNSTNPNEDRRESFLNEILDFSRHDDRVHTDGNDKGNTHYHQRWMFMLPFGKKGQGPEQQPTTTQNHPGTVGRAPPPALPPVPQDATCKLVFEAEGVQTEDDSLQAPPAKLVKPKMISDNVQTSFANFGMFPVGNAANNEIAYTNNDSAKSKAKSPALVTHGVQTTETEMKQSSHMVQTSFANMKTKKGKNATVDTTEEYFTENITETKDDMTSTTSFVTEPEPKRRGRNIKREKVTSGYTLQGNGNDEAAAEENNEEEMEESEDYYAASNVVDEKPKEQMEPDDDICPICRKGRYVTQMSVTGCFVAVLCLLCCGPFWCRKCCDITVCNFCGCSKGFYKTPNKAK